MSILEWEAMLASGRVQESWSGTTHVVWPPEASAYASASRSAVYVEFDVPYESVRPTQSGWAKVVGPNSLEGRLAARQGQPIVGMPAALNIVKK